jgi:hypothetical protein
MQVVWRATTLCEFFSVRGRIAQERPAAAERQVEHINRAMASPAEFSEMERALIGLLAPTIHNDHAPFARRLGRVAP